MKEINEQKIKSQAWKFYFVLFAWPVYLFLLPWAFSLIGGWAVFLMFFPGVFLFTWLGFLMHETWHKYVPGVPNGIFYNLFSWMLVTDPQVYNVLHWYHHSHVHTWEDFEFHPYGRIGNIRLRSFYNICEIVFGIVFLYLAAVVSIPSNPIFKTKFKLSSLFTAILAWIIIYCGIGFLSAFVFRIPAGLVVLVFLANLGLDSFILHQSQLVEHGNLIVEGDINKRNIMTRNLANKGIAARIFLFLTHWDSWEHVLHHTQTKIYSRPFPGALPLPPGATVISFREYLRLLRDMALGRENIIK